ncbi:DNA sulfur modification protein DndB [Pseudomonas nitroreducens]|uniref:DNA sulfur modification protein DndB n=1 Tax=Pseudomonas nitroreducens TaxID=46680 RepID=UPI0026589837|nr:DNA sulfur modification protein DndB [Pseudomonas nitroreducens]MCP1652287.1 DNA sulfur modification protein DndB [Pseudomonas nitroreducens]MCP1689797.1 DNA sulfur modification protein DndB [Pseudomonas nitroreducens]
MYDVVIAREACFLDKSISRGEVVSVHRDMVAAMNARDKLNKRKRAIHSESAFIAVHSENALRKGEIVEQLIDDYDREQRRAFCKRLMAAILSMELTGKPDRLADDAGFYLQQEGLSLDELRERYEQEVREEHQEHVLQQQQAAHFRARGYEAQKAIDIIRNEPCFSVPAVRGVQARGEFYLAQIPYSILAKLFVFDEEEAVPAELRAQRALNKKRAEDICEYMLANRDEYVLPALTASVDIAMAFEPFEGVPQLGMLHIPMSATMLINDGQHRRYAIELALKGDSTLQNETAPVQIHFDQGLKRSQQIFADINSKAVKPSSAINALYDHRNPYNAWIQQLLNGMPSIKKRIDFENATPGQRSYKLWSLVAFKKFVTLLTGVSERTIGGVEETRLQGIVELVHQFLEECGKHLPQWAHMISGGIPAADVREVMVIGHAVFLEALGIFGREALFAGTYLTPIERDAKVIDPSRARWHSMQRLAALETSKSDAMWENRCVVLGKMQKTTDGTKSTAAKLLQVAGIALPEDLAAVNGRVEASQ